MKKLTLAILSLVVATSAHAQLFIPKAGISLSKVELDVSQGMKSKIGFTLGIAYNHEVNEIFSVQPELYFIQKGFRQDFHQSENGLSIDADGKFAINYLELPILAKASFGEGDVKFFLNGGPYLAFGLGGKFKTDYTISFLGDSESETVEGKVKFGDSDDSDDETVYFDNRIEFGVQFGGGVMLNEKIMIDLRYGHGLTNMTDESGSNDGTGKSKHRVFQLTVGYPIRIK